VRKKSKRLSRKIKKFAVKLINFPYKVLINLFKFIFISKTKYGYSIRKFILIIFITVVSLGITFPSIINRGINYWNNKQTDLSNWNQLPFKQNGFDQWLTQNRIPEVTLKGINLGLDLQGGVRVVYDIDDKDVSENDRDQALESLRQVVNKRVNAFGVSEPRIYIESGDQNRLVVELAGLDNTKEAIERIGDTPKLEFYKGRKQSESQEIIDTIQSRLNSDEPIDNLDFYKNPYYDDTVSPIISGNNIERADVVFDPNTNLSKVSVTIDEEGKNKFAEFTKNNIGEILYIVLDENIVSGPSINQEIPNGQAVITGQFTTKETKDLVDSLNAGALPLPINLVSEQVVEASLGQDSLDKSIYAGVVGFILIIVFMIYWYRILGIISSVALVFYVILVLGIFKLLGFTLTLAGITGFLVSIGFAVDGNILIFERIKEELDKGRDLNIAIKEGFSRAWISIRDSQLSTLISSLILFYLASGVVQGFAITLSIGVIVSLFSSLTLSRIMLDFIDNYRNFFMNKKLGKWLIRIKK